MRQSLEYADRIWEILCSMAYMGAAGHFCKSMFPASRRRAALFVGSSILIWVLLNHANRQNPGLFLIFILVHHLLFAGLVLALFQGDREKKILAASLLMTVTTLVRGLCESLLSCLALAVQHWIKGIPEPLLGEGEGVFMVCAGYGLAIGAVFWMSRHLTTLFTGRTRNWYAILSLPLLALLVIADVAIWGASNGIMVRSAGNLGLYYDQLFSYGEFGILSALSLFAAGAFVLGMEKIDLEQKKNSRYETQIQVYQMLAEQYQQSERLRHDMKNHIIALSGLFHSQDWEKLGDYLAKLEEGCLETGGEATGSRAVDALLYQKRKQALQGRVAWECHVQLEREWNISEFDFCILFGNILDNALEACARLGNRGAQSSMDDGGAFVRIQARSVKKCFFLEAENSMDKTERPLGEMISMKQKRHGMDLPGEGGIGLQNIRDVVCRYNGVMHTEARDGIFRISILIPLEPVSQDAAVHDRESTV